MTTMDTAQLENSLVAQGLRWAVGVGLQGIRAVFADATEAREYWRRLYEADLPAVMYDLQSQTEHRMEPL